MLRRWRLPLVLTLVTGLMLGTLGTANAQTNATSFVNIPVEGTVEGTANTFEGELDITRFVVDDGALTAVGRLTGEITDAATGAVTPVNEAVRIPIDVAQATATCDILRLELGPIDLDLLGLVVHVDPILITIDAEQGPGNLLGNLLCAVAGLLDPDEGTSGLTQALARLLNRILSILG